MSYATLLKQAAAKVTEAKGLLTDTASDEDIARADALMGEAKALEARAGRIKEVEEADREIQTKMATTESGAGRAGGGEGKAFDAIYALRFGEEEKGNEAVLRGLVGEEYRQIIWDQNKAFERYLRGGEGELDREERRLLKRQIFPLSEIKRMVKEGMSLEEVKTVMVEAQGSLGGFAVPPNVQAEIITRLPGLTAVRAAGARVIELMNSNSIEIPKYTGGDKRYRGNLRGQWGSETQAPGEQNATLAMVDVVAHVYTYKVSKSQSLVEDAANLVEIVQGDITDTLSIDEEETFIIGDGVGKPLGILPGAANGLSLTEIVSGGASALTTAGVKALKRGIASQYRARGIWLGNSDTYSDIENLTVSGTGSDFAFPDLSDEEMLLKRKAYESEAMPDVAANAFPLLFGDMSGYYIVQRAGLTILRFQDSNTGINKVEYHVRRRVGGRVAEPWKFAVQKVAAS